MTHVRETEYTKLIHEGSPQEIWAFLRDELQHLSGSISIELGWSTRTILTKLREFCQEQETGEERLQELAQLAKVSIARNLGPKNAEHQEIARLTEILVSFLAGRQSVRETFQNDDPTGGLTR